jgi:hypothetical protein
MNDALEEASLRRQGVLPPPDRAAAADAPAARRVSAGGRGRGPKVLIAAAAAVVALIVVGVLALGGGGGGGDDQTAGGATSTTSATTSSTVDGGPPVSELLLTAADLPAEITSVTPLPLDTDDEPCGQQSVDLRIPPTGRAAFSAGDADGEISITEVVRQFTDPATARRAHGLVLDSFSCDTISIQNSSQESVEGRVSPPTEMAVPGVVSASYTTLDFGTFTVGLAMAHVDRYEVVMQYGSFDLQGSALEQQVRALLETAVRRLSTATA